MTLLFERCSERYPLRYWKTITPGKEAATKKPAAEPAYLWFTSIPREKVMVKIPERPKPNKNTNTILSIKLSRKNIPAIEIKEMITPYKRTFFSLNLLITIFFINIPASVEIPYPARIRELRLTLIFKKVKYDVNHVKKVSLTVEYKRIITQQIIK